MPNPVKSDPRSGTKRGMGAFAYESSTVFRLSGVFHLLSNGEAFLLLSPKWNVVQSPNERYKITENRKQRTGEMKHLVRNIVNLKSAECVVN